MAGFLRRLLGLDNAAASGDMELGVQYVDSDRPSQQATGRGVLRVSADTVQWQLEGRTRGERPWSDLTSWVQADEGESSRLLMTCAGEFQVGGTPAQLRVVVTLSASASAISLLTERASRFLAPEIVEVRPF